MHVSTTRSCGPATFFFFFFNDTATTEIYTLSLHDALPISLRMRSSTHASSNRRSRPSARQRRQRLRARADRKSTRLNSSHGYISYAVFCLKKKKKLRSLSPEYPLYIDLRALVAHVSTRYKS